MSEAGCGVDRATAPGLMHTGLPSDGSRRGGPTQVTLVALTALAMALTDCRTGPQPKAAGPLSSVVFVCEHGNVKSLIAASLFAEVAKARRLPFTAVSRGVVPEAAVPPQIAHALRQEGFEVGAFKPQPLGAEDLRSAARIVVIGVDPAALGLKGDARVIAWDDVPPATVDYGAARASLAAHLERLAAELRR